MEELGLEGAANQNRKSDLKQSITVLFKHRQPRHSVGQ